jgi:precorrin-3B synthase
MRDAGALRQGWCPGALRPMESGDGLIVRLRLIGGALAPDLGRAIADWAVRFGNGRIDLTSRANLQLRGVTEATLQPLQDALAGRGLLDADPDAEAVRNVMASPLAGLDPSALRDIRPSVRALDARLRDDPALHGLPAKFGFLVEDGGALPLAPDLADIAFVASGAGFDIHLGGEHAGHCAADALAESAAKIARSFLALRGADRRMAALVKRIGAAAVIAGTGLDYSSGEKQVYPDSSHRVIGAHDLGRYRAIGLGVPFGRFDADGLRRVADEAEAATGELRLTPWRAILIAGERIDAGLGDRLRDAGFILDADAPLRSVAACPGMPACRNGSTVTHEDGARLAPLAKQLGLILHVSGCAKGCAHSKSAPLTLVGETGRYDVVLNGQAGDPPAMRRLSVLEIAAVMNGMLRRGVKP